MVPISITFEKVVEILYCGHLNKILIMLKIFKFLYHKRYFNYGPLEVQFSFSEFGMSLFNTIRHDGKVKPTFFYLKNIQIISIRKLCSKNIIF